MRTAWILLGATLIGLAGCERGSGRKADPAPIPESKPPGTVPSGDGREATPPRSDAAAPKAAAPGAAAQKPGEPDAAEPAPEWPDFITVLEPLPHGRPRVAAKLDPDNRLVIDTQSVRRLRIDRSRTGTDARRSVSLQLDGQGIEWLPGSGVTEFERGPSGAWSPVKPGAAGRPARR